jgi:hypothetical protein
MSYLDIDHTQSEGQFKPRPCKSRACVHTHHPPCPLYKKSQKLIFRYKPKCYQDIPLCLEAIEIIFLSGKWTELEINMLGQTQTDKCHMFSLLCGIQIFLKKENKP